ncbi:MAG: PQQ-binding-like beta-propeller repeat protein [Pirellulaceae bacterium]
MKCKNLGLLVAVLFVPCSSPACGAEWPMWRHDARRSAAAPSALPPRLDLQWRKEFQPPEPAYPGEVRLNFDASYQPIAAGGMVFVPSMVTDSVTALNAETGDREWEFYTDGPVRFAPVAWRGSVYFTSDDGYLYCLNAADGELEWKFWGPPVERKPYRLLGNGRLISRWAARGGPVLKDGIVYFGCGLWPSEGVYVCAVDAESGELVWRNGKLAHIEQGLVDHSARRDVGLTPTGYLAVAGDRLIVPAGRALPAIFSRQSGRMEPYCTGWGGRGGLARGSWWVATAGNYYMTSGELYGLTGEASRIRDPLPPEQMKPDEFTRATGLSGEQVRQWMESGELPTVQKDGERLVDARTEKGYLTWGEPRSEAEKHVITEHPRLQISPANQYNMQPFRTPVLTSNTMIYSVPSGQDSAIGRRLDELPHGSRFIGERTDEVSFSGIASYDLGAELRWGLSMTRNAPGAPVRAWNTLRFDRLWTVAADLKVYLKAGSSLYAGRPGLVAALQLEGDKGDTGRPKVSWQENIDGAPSTMLAAEERLFVMTRQGTLYCFGAGKPAQSDTTAENPDRSRPDARDNNGNREAFLKYADGKKGYCLVLDRADPGFLRELCRRSDFHVIALHSDEKAVRAARERLDRDGLYGTRVHIVPGDLSTVRLPRYLASLVISPENTCAGLGNVKQLVRRVSSLLHPREGVGHLAVSGFQPGSLNELDGLAPDEIRIQKSEGGIVLRRSGVTKNTASWTHEAGGPDNAFANADETVRPPFGVLWFGGAIDRLWPSWDYTHSRPPRPLVCDGRMFFLVANRVHAADAYTGRPLWTTTLKPSDKGEQLRQEHFVARRNTADNYIATPDTLYLVGRSCCRMLDTKTGARTGKINTPPALKDSTPREEREWHEARVWRDSLLVAMGRFLVCMDRRDGAPRWKISTDKDRLTFAVGNGRVYAADYWLAERRRKGEEKNGSTTLRAVDLATGASLWKATAMVPPESVNAPRAGWLKDRIPPLPPYVSYCEGQDVVLLSATYSVAAACEADDGTLLWQRSDAIPISRARPPVVLSDRFVSRTGMAYDILTGEPRGDQLWSSLRACNRALGNRKSLFVRDGLPMACDFRTGEKTYFMSTRSGCTNSLIPADGVLAAPNFAVGCACNYPVVTSFAAAHLPEAGKWRDASRGP